MDERILEEGAGDIAQEYNDQLYARTTAGQVLPETVRSVECN